MNISRLSASVLLAATAVAALAVPARRTPFTVEQPDGSTLTVRLFGDEHRHFYTTVDTLLLTQTPGDPAFYYARPDAKGLPVSTGLIAADPARRTATDREMLAKLSTPAMLRALDARADNGPRRAHTGLFPGASFPVMGDQKAIVILVEYDDYRFVYPDPHSYFNSMLNEKDFCDPTYGGTGSARDWFIENSAGKFVPQFDLYGPVKLAHSRSYYGANDFYGNDQAPEEMVIEACRALDDEIDFREYDRNGDGVVDNVFVFYAGGGEATGAGANTVWPHSYSLSSAGKSLTLDGVKIDTYGCTNEVVDNHPDGVGTFCHEFSHVIGLPDLYATSYTSSFTPGTWSALDYGPYNNIGRTPPLYSSFERNALGWMTPRQVRGATTVSLPPISENTALMVATGDENEFFLFENRRREGWDAYIPGEGMLVWHIDYEPSVWERNTVNNTSSHQYVDIEEADNRRTESSRDGDCFPGTSNVTSFTDDTTPSMRSWSGIRPGLPLTNIAEDADGNITFDVAGGGKSVDAVKANDATDITDRSVRLSWQAADDATDYRVSVYTTSSAGGLVPVDACNEVTTKGATELTVDGLEPLSDYSYTVTAIGGVIDSEPSQPIAFSTKATSITMLTAETNEATDITADSFTASWLPLDGATAYRLSVVKKEYSGGSETTADFTGGLSKLPEGWKSTSTATYASQGYFGAESPSLKLTADENTLTTPEAPTSSLSFWYRCAAGAEGAESSLTVKLLDAIGQWRTYAILPLDYPDDNRQGHTAVFEALPDDTRSIAITFQGKQGAAVAIDDVTITTGATVNNTPVKGFAPYDAGNALSAKVTGLEPMTLYAFSVSATSPEGMSLPSIARGLRTLDGPDNAIETVGDTCAPAISTYPGHLCYSGDTPVDIYAIDGRRVCRLYGPATISLLPGIYIASTGISSAKVIVP